MKAIATFGAGGQVGYALGCAQWPSGVRHVPLEHHLCDIADHNKVLAQLERASISLVINAAAYTAVDLAESHAEQCWATNAQGPANLARGCAAMGIPVIQISTDYVFDGNKGAPYLEDDPIAPINTYGRAKAAGEQAVREATPQHIILRVACVYSARRFNFVRTILNLARRGSAISVVTDRFTCPTPAEAIADAIVKMVGRFDSGDPGFPWGTYHYCGQFATSWYDFSCAILEGSKSVGGPVIEVEPIRAVDRPSPAERPRDPRLDCSKIERVFGIAQPYWKENLSQVVTELLSQKEPL